MNLIALNPTPLSTEKAPTKRAMDRFVRILRDLDVNVTVRDTRGRDIDAACGQLRAERGRRQPVSIG